MGAPIGNQNAIGNKGGGRPGYTFSNDQFMALVRLVDYGLALIEAYQKDRISDKEFQKYLFIEKIFLKAIDKLHPNKKYQKQPEKSLLPTPISEIAQYVKHRTNP